MTIRSLYLIRNAIKIASVIREGFSLFANLVVDKQQKTTHYLIFKMSDHCLLSLLLNLLKIKDKYLTGLKPMVDNVLLTSTPPPDLLPEKLNPSAPGVFVAIKCPNPEIPLSTPLTQLKPVSQGIGVTA